jgi:hypothetical protein
MNNYNQTDLNNRDINNNNQIIKVKDFKKVLIIWD